MLEWVLITPLQLVLISFKWVPHCKVFLKTTSPNMHLKNLKTKSGGMRFASWLPAKCIYKNTSTDKYQRLGLQVMIEFLRQDLHLAIESDSHFHHKILRKTHFKESDNDLISFQSDSVPT